MALVPDHVHRHGGARHRDFGVLQAAHQALDSREQIGAADEAGQASGGLSHQLDGERAGFINKEFDLQFMDSLVSNPEWATQFSSLDLVEKTGTQGVELLMWLAMRAALSVAGPRVQEVHR